MISEERTTHKMKLNPAPFEMIKGGHKTIELRLYDEKRRAVAVGDTIIFVNTENGEAISATVKALHVFADFCELYSSLPLLSCGYTEENVGKASPSDMELYYTADEQKKYGVVGIELIL